MAKVEIYFGISGNRYKFYFVFVGARFIAPFIGKPLVKTNDN
jgi:hypothetical protein